MMTDQGFRVTSARQSRSRIEGKAPFTRHLLRLHHESFLDGRDEVPEVVLMNSHRKGNSGGCGLCQSEDGPHPGHWKVRRA